MFELTIEQKILLAENAMGLQKIGHETFYQMMYLQTPPGIKQELTGFFCVTHSVFHSEMVGTVIYIQLPNDEHWCEWQPETDDGDAARLLMALPYARLVKFRDGDVQTETDTPRQFMARGFCEAICLIALDYAEGLRNESNS